MTDFTAPTQSDAAADGVPEHTHRAEVLLE